ncbi:hypothetical protein NKZ03_00630 [Sinorhizobium meliloti]|uniref:hypothetical protein n=1 Tax=Rhizobium meliloti TaxID=382 RepID=UPI003D65447C
MKAVVMKEVGGTDVMEFVDRPEPVARPAHVVVEVAAVPIPMKPPLCSEMIAPPVSGMISPPV